MTIYLTYHVYLLLLRGALTNRLPLPWRLLTGKIKTVSQPRGFRFKMISSVSTALKHRTEERCTFTLTMKIEWNGLPEPATGWKEHTDYIIHRPAENYLSQKVYCSNRPYCPSSMKVIKGLWSHFTLMEFFKRAGLLLNTYWWRSLNDWSVTMPQSDEGH